MVFILINFTKENSKKNFKSDHVSGISRYVRQWHFYNLLNWNPPFMAVCSAVWYRWDYTEIQMRIFRFK